MSLNETMARGPGVSRRAALRRGVQGAAGVLLAGGLASRLRAAEPGKTEPEAKAKSVIQIFLWGGMSHNDTWDPKPESGREYMGEFSAVIPTNVDGIQIGALFPQLARQADKYSLIRSMTHGNNGHETAAYLMQTGHAPGERLAYPSVGAVFALFKSRGYTGIIPPYVVLTKPQGRFSEEGFLGPKYKPFASGGDPNARRFEVEGVVARNISDDRQQARRGLLDTMNTMGRLMAASPQMTAAAEAREQAYELILGAGKEVFDLSKEEPELRDRYAATLSARSAWCAEARRDRRSLRGDQLSGGWDTHNGPLPDDAAAGPSWIRAGNAAPGLERSRAAGDDDCLVLRRISGAARRSTGSPLEWRPEPLWQGVFGPGGGRRIQRGCVVGSSDERPRRSSSGRSIPSICSAASTNWRASTARQAAPSDGRRGLRPARVGRREVGRPVDRNRLARRRGRPPAGKT